MSPLLIAMSGAGMLIAGGVVAMAYAAAVDPAITRTATALTARMVRFGRRDRIGHLGAAVLAGAATAAVTGWPVAGILTGAATWWLPRLLGPDHTTSAAIARVEAVAAWAEMLRDMIAGASGLQHAIATTAPIAPEPIREEVMALNRSLAAGSHAFTRFAHQVAVPTGDLVAIALSSAVSGHAADIGASLARMAEAARERATTLGRIAASRARLRSSVRIIVATTAVMAAGLIITNRPFLAPFDTVGGQAVLAVVGVLWALALMWLMGMSRPEVGHRLLAPAPETAEVGR